MSKAPSKVHRITFYNPKPLAITCASLNKSTKLFALAREDASIEIWDLNHSPYLLKFIPSIENGSVEAVCWVKDRLLSTGLSGALVEWDLDRYVIKNTVMLTGYAAWCLDVSPDNTLIAAGTEQGYINLYNVEFDSIAYDKLFDKQEGRILCCKFNPTGKILATGSINTIRVWDVEKGVATNRLSVKKKHTEVIVWCLAFVTENTLASGDSLGRLSFWDTDLGDQIDTFTTHNADITALTVTENGQNLYCSGVDPVIIHFTKVKQTDDTSKVSHQWVKNVQRHIHEHDVRVLDTIGERELISAGKDGYLTFSSFPPKWIMRMPPMVPAPRSFLCSEKKLMLLRYSNYLELWKLGTFKDPKTAELPNTEDTAQVVKQKPDTEKKPNVEQDTTDAIYNRHAPKNAKILLDISEHPLMLVSVQAKKRKPILCCAMSPTGEYIFYSTTTELRLLKVDIPESEAENDQSIFMSKLAVSGARAPCDRAAFTHDGRFLVAHGAGALHLLQVDPDVGATLVHTVATDKFFKSKSLLHLEVSSPSRGVTYVAAADCRGSLAVWALAKKLEHSATLPAYHCVPSAVSFDAERGVLYVVYVDQTIVEYSLWQRSFAEWPASVLPESWRRRTAAVHGARAHPARDAVVLHDQNSLWIVDKQLQVVAPAPASKKSKNKQNVPTEDDDVKMLKFKILPIKYLAGFHWLNSTEAVTLELLPANILAQLPPVIAQKKH